MKPWQKSKTTDLQSGVDKVVKFLEDVMVMIFLFHEHFINKANVNPIQAKPTAQLLLRMVTKDLT
jgi:hypothetical protein